MRLPSFDESRKIENDAIPLWEKLLKKIPGFVEFHFTENKKAQTQEHYDGLLSLAGKGKIFRLDFKTRTPYYYDKFQNDSKICIEIEGHVGKNLGSSIYNSNADILAYGFASSHEIMSPYFFKVEKVAEFLKKHEKEFKSIFSETSKLYKTKCLLVPLRDLLPFSVNFLEGEN